MGDIYRNFTALSVSNLIEHYFLFTSTILIGFNIPGIFIGTILNREHIGKTGEELVSMWNADNPTDLVE